MADRGCPTGSGSAGKDEGAGAGAGARVHGIMPGPGGGGKRGDDEGKVVVAGGPMPATLGALPREREEGNCEYKLHLLEPSPERFLGLVTQMMWRCREGGGACVYWIGVTDDGCAVGLPPKQMKKSLDTLRAMVKAAGATIVSIRITAAAEDETGQVAQVRVRRPLADEEEEEGEEEVSGPARTHGVTTVSASTLAPTAPATMPPHRPPNRRQEVTVAVCGGRDTGKSTWVACVTHGMLDDGGGSARFCVFKHRHEVEDGRTSSIGRHVLGFDACGNPVNASSRMVGPAVSFGSSVAVGGGGIDVLGSGMSTADIVGASTSLVSLLDLAGDSKYIRTTIGGLLGSSPDYVQVMVPAKLPPVGVAGGAAMEDEDSVRTVGAGVLPAIPPARVKGSPLMRASRGGAPLHAAVPGWPLMGGGGDGRDGSGDDSAVPPGATGSGDGGEAGGNDVGREGEEEAGVGEVPGAGLTGMQGQGQATPTLPPRPKLDPVTREHLLLAISLRIPFYVVLTKVDQASPQEVECTMAALNRFLRRFMAVATTPANHVAQGGTASPHDHLPEPTIMVTTREGAMAAAQVLGPRPAPPSSLADAPAGVVAPVAPLVPVFMVSNVTGAGMPLLMAFLSALAPRHDWSSARGSPAEMYIDEVLSVDGATIVAGLVNRGTLRAGSTVQLGPDLLGHFAPVVIASVQVKRVPVAAARAGNAATFRLITVEGAPVPRESVRKGQVLLQGPAWAGGEAASNHSRRRGGDGRHHPAAATGADAERSNGSHGGGGGVGLEWSSASSTSHLSTGAGGTPSPRLCSTTTFDAAVTFCKPSHCTFRVGHMVVVHCVTIRQAARVMAITPLASHPTFGPPTPVTALASPTLTTGVPAAAVPPATTTPAPSMASPPQPRTPRYHASVRVTLRFAHHPEFVMPGATVILRDGRAIAAGCVTTVQETEMRSSSAPAVRRRPRLNVSPAPHLDGRGGSDGVGGGKEEGTDVAGGVGGAPVLSVKPGALNPVSRVRHEWRASHSHSSPDLAEEVASAGPGAVLGAGRGTSLPTATAGQPAVRGSLRPRSHTVHFMDDAGYTHVSPVVHSDLDAPVYGSGGAVGVGGGKLPPIAFTASSAKATSKRARGSGGSKAAPAGRPAGGVVGAGMEGDSEDDDSGGLLAAWAAAGGRL